MSLKEIVIARNATKKFDGKKTPREKVEELIIAAARQLLKVDYLERNLFHRAATVRQR